MDVKNLFDKPPESSAEEIIDILHASDLVRIERIVSLGHASPPGFWYDQPADEWVLLVAGAARLRFKDEAEPLELKPGDYCHIAARRRHRVDWTDPATPTIWLAIHLGN
jgi:cupin 2 domain-containing protein